MKADDGVWVSPRTVRRLHRCRGLHLAVLVLVAAGCGGGGTSGDMPDTSALADAADAHATEADVVVNRGRGEACTTGADCTSARCIGAETGAGVCAGPTCTDCPAGWACDGTLCLPHAFWVCAPCVTATDCAGGTRCLPLGSTGAKYCLIEGCSTTPGASADCPTATTCQDVKDATACVPDEGACPCTADHEGLVTTCGAAGGCSGTRACVAGALGECVAGEPGQELCDGLDNDCDGQTDEDSAASCDDGVACTIDTCTDGACAFAVASGKCLIGAACWDTGAANPVEGCEECDPARDDRSWSSSARACDDGDPCTVGDRCENGTCTVGKDPFCHDALACTTDSCVCDGCVTPTCAYAPTGVGSCVIDGACIPAGTVNPSDPCLICTPAEDAAGWSAHAGVTCDDGDPCTLDDLCTAAKTCEGTGMVCDDGEPCTNEVCKGGYCEVETVKDSGCFIDGECHALGDAQPKNPCGQCNGLKNAFGWTAKADDQPCGSNCYVGGTCLAGTCQGGTVLCECYDDSDCNDDNRCNGSSVCIKDGPVVFWHCDESGSSSVVCADTDASDCRVDQCNPKTGACDPVAVGDGNACTDGDPCSTGDVCASGTCVASEAACDDNNPCTDDGCGATGCTHVPNIAPCDDGDGCTTGDACAQGGCRAGVVSCGCAAVADCPAVSPCVGTYACEGSPTKACVLIPTPPCNTANDTVCASTACNAITGSCAVVATAAGTACDDGDACTSSTQCDGKGACTAGTPVPCDDGNLCTVETCSATSGCVVTPLTGEPCDDGDPCSLGDLCQAGSCTGGKDRCACQSDSDCPFIDGDRCNGSQRCDLSGSPADWHCVPTGEITLCAGVSDACSHPVCDPETGACIVGTTPAGTFCDDGDPCTFDDACVDGVCRGLASGSCNDGLACTLDACNGLGGCTHEISAGCVINGACVGKDVASPSNGCQVCDPAMSTTAYSARSFGGCDDENACTTADACASGVCVGLAVNCDDGLTCTVDSCAAGTCSHAVAAGACLIGGACYAVGADNPANSCQQCATSAPTAWSNRTGSCEDKNQCTVGDTCVSGACKAGATRVCDDGNVCTTDSCSPNTGCTTTPATGACTDTDACTVNETCVDGACKGTNICNCTVADDCKDSTDLCLTNPSCVNKQCAYQPVDCPADGPCSLTTCDSTSGKCVPAPINPGVECDDGNGCTSKSVCEGIACVGTATVSCDDNNICTSESCDPARPFGNACVRTNVPGQAVCYTGPAGTRKVGLCKDGTQTCSGGALGACTGQVTPTTELCDLADNDCDGAKDEDFPTVGKACDGPDSDQCATGLFACATNGLGVTCVETGAGIPEACNGLDDDCDGVVDNGCDDDKDGYCDNALGVVGPNAACKPGDCNDGVAAISPAAADLPDTSIVDSNCDGIDGDITRAIFVSNSCGLNTNKGIITSPVQTLERALNIATNNPALTQILIDRTDSTGQKYSGGLTLVAGVGLYGGYAAHTTTTTFPNCHLAWSRASPTTNPTQIERTMTVAPSSGIGFAMVANGLAAQATLQWLRIELKWQLETGSKGPYGAYGIFVVGGNLLVEGCTVIAPDGRPGVDGNPGLPGPAGQPGTRTDTSDPGAGGLGTFCRSTPMGLVVTSWAGGSGGTGGKAGGNPGTTGVGGSGPPVAAGYGGFPGAAYVPCIEGGGGEKASPLGQAGGDGVTALSPANAGASATDPNGADAPTSGWTGAAGISGNWGDIGAGGGGGGGGGTAYLVNLIDTNAVPGGGGGGAGSGGCGGLGGQGGSAGGGSFALFIVSSGTSAPAVQVVGSVLTAGRGGNGGRGGDGGLGGSGGQGADGRPIVVAGSCTGSSMKYVGGSGGKGGAGAKGQTGGAGGAGAGGVSYAIYYGNNVTKPVVTGSTLSTGGGGNGGPTNGYSPAGVNGASGLSNKPL